MSEQRSDSNRRICSNVGSSKRRRSSNAARAVALAAIGAIAGLTATANAADKLWDTTLGDWENPNNWLPVGVPTSADVARVDNGGIAVLSTDQSITHVIPGSALGSSGTVRQTGGILTAGGHVLIAEGGATSTGLYEMSGGAINAAGVVYAGSHGTGTLDLSGTGSINAAANFQVGVQGTAVGTVNMSGGSITTPTLIAGHVNSGNGTINLGGGTITVGSPSTPTHTSFFLGIHHSSSGTVNQTGGTLNVFGQVQMATESSTTSATYDISGGTFNAFNDDATAGNDVSVRVGNRGTGTMKVRGTGVANIGRHIIVGGNAADTGVGTLEVHDSGELNVGMGAANTGGILGIGANGVANSVQSGGVINTDFFWNGYVQNGVSQGQSTQTGGTLNVAENLDIGRASAQDNFYDISGGAINVGGDLTVARSSTDPSAGPVVYSNGRLTVGGTANVAVTGQLANSGGFVIDNPDPEPDTFRAGGTGVIEMNGGTLTAGSFLNGADANTGTGASATYNQTGGTASVGHVTGTGNISVSGGTMNVNSLRQSAANVSSTGLVQVTPGGTTSQLGSLGISGSGKVDLTNNTLLTTATPAATVRQYLKTGYNGGNWMGNGLTSSSAAANPSGRALGHSTDAGGVTTVMYTVAGDANLSGSVDGSDFNIWNANRFQAGEWDDADFNYSDTVDGSDFNIWNANRFQSVEAAGASARGTAIPASHAGENIPLFIYDPSDGTLHMDTHQSGTDKLVSFLVEGPAALEILKFQNGTFDEGNGWAQQFFDGREQWIATFGDGVAGAWDIARYATGLELSSFGEVEYGVRRADGTGFTGFTNVALVPEPTALGLIGLVGLGMLARRRRAA